MKNTINEKLILAVLKFKKINIDLMSESDVRMNEVVTMLIIDEDSSGSEKTKLISKICEALCITQSAVSQMFASLEKRGYICRNIDQNDKRKFLFALTEKGRQIAHSVKKEADSVLDSIISSYGEDKTLKLIQMLTEFAEVSALVKNDIIKKARE